MDEVITFYELRTGDVVRITVFNEGDLSVEQKLDPDGVIVIPLLGRVSLKDKTLREAESYVENLFMEQEFLIQPQVSISMVQHADQVFYIFGEVRSTGAKSFPTGKGSLDILEALTMAGGMTQYAKRTEVIIRRPIEDTDQEEKIVLDLDKVIRGSKRGNQELVKVYPQDIIYVPERLF